MMITVSDWIAKKLAGEGIRHNFTVTGGGAIYLNMSLGTCEGIKSVYFQHEQAAAIAAEGYYRTTNELPLVCCTTGPGGTNTLTGVLGAWLDSIPMLVISGQVRYAVTARAAGLPLRAVGDQEFDITPMVSHMTKYAQMVIDPLTIRYHLEKALYLARHGRPGPVWLDIPLDVQSARIDPERLADFDPAEDGAQVPPKVTVGQVKAVIEKVARAKRPVLNVGNGIHIAGCEAVMRRAAEKLGIPIVTAWNATDLFPHDHELFAGIPGLLGDRPGNWAIQNADLVLSVGCRLSCRQVGYNVNSWAREAFVIMVDIDPYELQKPSIHAEMPLCADASDFFEQLDAALSAPLDRKTEWVNICQNWKKSYPVVSQKHYQDTGAVNAYCFLNEISRKVPNGQTIVLANGTVEACLHAIHIKEGVRLICNSGAASMGYGLPAAIGSCFASGKADTVCLTGDGSIQMNLQELQTVVTNKLPIKIFVVNNQGYHSIRQTESNLFPDFPKVGIGPDSGDLSFPSMEKIANAYGIPYLCAKNNAEVSSVIDRALSSSGYVLCELVTTLEQSVEPRSATKRLQDGTLFSPPLEDLAPFLPREELRKIMLIPLYEEK